MKVYGNPHSTCTRKVLTTLAEKNHPAEFINVDLGKGEHKQPAHLARQPFGVVPVLEDDDFRMYESRAIIRYLDARLPGVALTPKDQRARGRMEQWISVEQSYFNGPAMRIIMQLHFGPMRGAAPDMAVVEQAKRDLQRPLDVIDQALAGTPYLAGEAFSLADISWMPYVEYLFSSKQGELITSRKNV